MLHIVMSSNKGEHSLQLQRTREPLGFQVIEGGGLFAPWDSFICFLDSIKVGTNPWAGYAPINKETGKADPTRVTRIRHGGSLIIQVSR